VRGTPLRVSGRRGAALSPLAGALATDARTGRRVLFLDCRARGQPLPSSPHAKARSACVMCVR
jgi:hypothetical protein